MNKVRIAIAKATRELAAIFAALVLMPLGPALAVSYGATPWQGMALAALWGASWYVWLWAKMRAGLTGFAGRLTVFGIVLAGGCREPGFPAGGSRG